MMNINDQRPLFRYPNTIPGIFVRRLNRFTAQVMIDDHLEKVHVKNTGRLRELLLPEAKVMLQKSDKPNIKTAFDLISVYKLGLEWVNIDSLVPNALVKKYLEIQEYDLVKPEYNYGKSRFDFYMEKDGEKYLTEVKGCTLAADLDGKKIGLFPDAPTERGVKHLNELVEAAKAGYHCSISFVIQMNGIRQVLPNDQTHPEFGRALKRAVDAGMEIVYYQCRVEADCIEIISVCI